MDAGDRLERGRLVFAAPCRFLLGAAAAGQIPDVGPPEVAFAGRSNVGKSSLLNALTGRRDLARASVTPGRTREINFFDLGGRLRLVDLPGFGYARASRKDAERWHGLARAYLKGRASLRRALLLVDARRGLSPPDADLMRLLDESGVPYQIVLTKADKVKPSDLEAATEAIAAALARRPAAHPAILRTSAQTGEGVAELRAALAELAAPL